MAFQDVYGAIGSVEDADRLRINAAYNPQTGSYAGYGGGYGSSGAGGFGSREQLYGEFRSMFDKANSANESRYQDIKGRYEARRNRTLADLQGSGDQERRDIETQYQGAGSRLGQSMVSRGLTGSSIGPTLQMGVEREKTDALGRLNERLRQQRIGYDTGLDQDTLQFMERKNEVGPDLGMLMQLSQGLGGQGGGGGAYSNYGVGGGFSGASGRDSSAAGQFWQDAPPEGQSWSPYGAPYGSGYRFSGGTNQDPNWKAPKGWSPYQQGGLQVTANAFKP